MGFWDEFSIEGLPGPKYQAIRDALARAIRGGRLGPGRQLPSHRMMAMRLGVSPGTVTRAYQIALDEGLISGEIGRGTFVSFHPPTELSVVSGSRIPARCLDLYQNLPVPVPAVENSAWIDVLEALRRETDLATMSRSSWSEVSDRHRRAGATWIERTGLQVDPRFVFDCPGVMASLCAIFGAVARPGDVVAAPVLSHPLPKLLASQYSLKMVSLRIDEQGIDPDDFESVCKEESPCLLYCAPTIHSPTTVTFSEDRRRTLAELAARHDVWIVEDEYASFLLPSPPPPIAGMAPDRTFLIADVWQALSLGLRTSYILVPERWLGPMSAAIACTSGITPPLIAEIAARWIEEGAAERLIRARRKELKLRNDLARDLLRHPGVHSHPLGHHLWLRLTEGWTADLFALRAEQRGIAVNPGTWFLFGHGDAPEGVRVSIGNAPDRDSLRWALRELDTLLREPAYD